MNKQIIIQKNASCQFPFILTDNNATLIKELKSIVEKVAKEVLFIKTSSKMDNYINEICNSFNAKCIYTDSVDINNILMQATDENKLLIWFASNDYETVLSLKNLSLKGLDYILIPATPIAQITCEYIYDIWSEKATEYFPLTVLSNISLWKEVSQDDYITGLAAVLRKGIQENAIFYEWFLGNMYEVFEKDDDFLTILLEKNADLLQKRLDKKTAAGRCVPHFGSMFEFCIANACKELNAADVISMSCLMHAYLAWSKQILSMEEFYEIRDMFVAFDMGISETTAKAEVLIEYLRKDETVYSYGNFIEFPYLSKIGKIITNNIPTEKDLLDAAMAIYFDEEAMA